MIPPYRRGLAAGGPGRQVLLGTLPPPDPPPPAVPPPRRRRPRWPWWDRALIAATVLAGELVAVTVVWAGAPRWVLVVVAVGNVAAGSLAVLWVRRSL